jgi:signal peptidase II
MQATGRTAPLRRPATILAIAAAAIVVVDQITKAVVVSNMSEGQTIPVIDGVLHWTFVRNPGAAFSLFTQVPWLFTILASLISLWIISQARKLTSLAQAWCFGAILGGALGNLIDRFFRAPGGPSGHVVDMIDLRVWPVFNVADMGVTLGALALVIVSWREERSKKEATG